MGFSAFKLLRSVDDFGHAIKVTYKGEEQHQTTFGGLLTIGVRVFVLIAIIKAAVEVVNMDEPQIKSLERPLSISDRENTGQIILGDYNYYIGFRLDIRAPEGILPKELGQFVAEV